MLAHFLLFLTFYQRIIFIQTHVQFITVCVFEQWTHPGCQDSNQDTKILPTLTETIAPSIHLPSSQGSSFILIFTSIDVCLFCSFHLSEIILYIYSFASFAQWYFKKFIQVLIVAISFNVGLFQLPTSYPEVEVLCLILVNSTLCYAVYSPSFCIWLAAYHTDLFLFLLEHYLYKSIFKEDLWVLKMRLFI